MASTNSENRKNSCRSSSCGCEPKVIRRDVLQVLGAGAAASALPIGTQVMDGPFAADDVANHLIPADKKLTREWVASLTSRGQAEVFSGEQLKYVGMPVGGIGCGQLYLGGDGRLWLWDIFKCNYDRESDHGRCISAFTLGGTQAGRAVVKLDGRNIDARFHRDGQRTVVRFPQGLDIAAGQTLHVQHA